MKRFFFAATLMFSSLSFSMTDDEFLADLRNAFETNEEFDGKVTRACIVRDNVVTKTCVTVDRRNRSLYTYEYIEEVERKVTDPRDPPIVEGGNPGGSFPISQSGIKDLIQTMGKSGIKGKVRVKYKTKDTEVEIEVEVSAGTGAGAPQ